MDYFPDGLIINSNSYWMELEPSLSSLYTTVYGVQCMGSQDLASHSGISCSELGHATVEGEVSAVVTSSRELRVRFLHPRLTTFDNLDSAD